MKAFLAQFVVFALTIAVIVTQVSAAVELLALAVSLAAVLAAAWSMNKSKSQVVDFGHVIGTAILIVIADALLGIVITLLVSAIF